MTQPGFLGTRTAVAFGRFDGVHRGHEALLKELVRVARDAGIPSVVACLIPGLNGGPRKRLNTIAECHAMIDRLGVDFVLMLPYNAKFAELDPVRFYEMVLRDQLGAQIIVAGDNVVFGRQRAGNEPLLKQLAERDAIDLITVPAVRRDDRPITSERIMAALRAGEIDDANAMLGHTHFYRGEIVLGNQLGRTVGMPTANMAVAPFLQLPQYGVYGTLIRVDGLWHKGLTNIGTRPSVDNYDYVTIETYILDFDEDLYGKSVELELHAFIRGIQKFDGIEAVKAQVGRDIERIRDRLDGLVTPDGKKR